MCYRVLASRRPPLVRTPTRILFLFPLQNLSRMPRPSPPQRPAQSKTSWWDSARLCRTCSTTCWEAGVAAVAEVAAPSVNSSWNSAPPSRNSWRRSWEEAEAVILATAVTVVPDNAAVTRAWKNAWSRSWKRVDLTCRSSSPSTGPTSNPSLSGVTPTTGNRANPFLCRAERWALRCFDYDTVLRCWKILVAINLQQLLSLWLKKRYKTYYFNPSVRHSLVYGTPQ